MRNAKDQIRAAVVNGRVQSREVREQIEALHPPAEKMDRLIANDAKCFQSAMLRAGLDPTVSSMAWK